MNIKFKTYNDNQKLVDTPLVDVSVITTDTNYIYADEVAKLSSINVFLNKNNTQQKFIITQSGEQDTIDVFYNSEIDFISNGCGFRANFNLENVAFSKKNIKAVNIINAQINETASNHLEVIYK